MPRVESLTGLRWFAAFAVFFFHANQLAPIPRVHEFLAFGDAGVTFFYVLSGFVLTWSFSADVGTLTFFWRRFARVWPMLVVSTAIAWVLLEQAWQDSWRQTLLSLTLVEAWWRPAVVPVANPVAWSISCEAFFYLVFPVLIRPLLRARPAVLVGLTGLLFFLEWGYWITVRQFIDPAEFWVQLSWFLRFPPFRLIEFTLGMIAAVALRRGWRPPINLWFALSLVPASMLVLWWGAERGWWQPYWSEQAMLPAFVVVVVAAAVRDVKGLPSFLRSKLLVTLGAWSYAFYLVHLSVIHWLSGVVRTAPLAWGNLKVMLMWAVVGALLAGACYTYVEHPMERRLRRLYPRRSSRVGSVPVEGGVPVDVSVPVGGATEAGRVVPVEARIPVGERPRAGDQAAVGAIAVRAGDPVADGEPVTGVDGRPSPQ